jgi:hypothetical protein
VKIRELEETVQRVNRENNEMKKDLKIVTEMRKFLQRRVNFLEEENRKLLQKDQKKTNKDEGIKDLKIWGTEMMEMFQSPTRVMDGETGDYLNPKHYNSNKNSIMNSFDKNNSQVKLENFEKERVREITINEAEFNKKKKKRPKMKNLEIMIPENEEKEETRENQLNDSKSKRKMRFQIKRKSNIIENDLILKKKKKKKKKTMNILIPEDDIKQKVKSTKMNKKIHFDNELNYKPSQENTHREMISDKKELLFEKKKHVDKYQVADGVDPVFFKNFTKSKPGKPKNSKKTKKRKNKKFQKGTLKMMSSSNLEKDHNQKIHTSYKRIHNKNKGIWFLDSKKREKRQGRIRRGTEGAMYSAKNGSASLMMGMPFKNPQSKLTDPVFDKFPRYRLSNNKVKPDMEDVLKKTVFSKKKKYFNPKYGLIQSVNEIDLHSQKNIRRYKKQISIDPQDRIIKREWISHENSQEDSDTGESQKIIYSNRNLIVDRIKTEPHCQNPTVNIEFPENLPNSSFHLNNKNKNSCSISVSDIKSEKKMTAPLQNKDKLSKQNSQNLNQIFSFPHHKKQDSRKDFAMTHLFLQNPGRNDIYKNLNIKTLQKKDETSFKPKRDYREKDRRKMITPNKQIEIIPSSKKSNKFKFSEELLQFDQMNLPEKKSSTKYTRVNYDIRNNPLNLTGKIHLGKPVKKKERLSVKSGISKPMKVQNYTSSRLRVVGQKYPGGFWYQDNIIGKMARKSKLTESNRKYISKERKRRVKQKKKLNEKDFLKGSNKSKLVKKKRQNRISNNIDYSNIGSSKGNAFTYKDSISNSESAEDKFVFDGSNKELKSLEMQFKSPVTNTYNRKNEDALSEQRAQYHSCKSIVKGQEKLFVEESELIKNKSKFNK